MKAWCLLIKFEEKFGMASEYLSRDVRIFDSGWGSETFGRAIESVQFFLPTGHCIVLQGMSQYNFFLECSMELGARSRIDAIWVCGLLPNSLEVEMWRIAQGSVTRSRSQFGEEWGGGPTSGWKPGVPGPVFSKIIQA